MLPGIGPTPLPSWQLVLQERDETFDPRLAQQRIILEEYVEGGEVADHTTFMPPASLSRLKHGGVSFLDMLLFYPSTSSNNILESGNITGQLEAIDVPLHCLFRPEGTDLDDQQSERRRPSATGEGPDCERGCLNTGENEVSRMSKCIDEGKLITF